MSERAERVTCVFCGGRADGAETATFPCNVRAFLGRPFRVWRCPGCRTIHCHDVVDLGAYYAKYPIHSAELSWPMRVVFRRQLGRLRRFGFDRGRSLLDYGSGGGAFVRYLREKGYGRVAGYDPYARPGGPGDRSVLAAGPFEFVLLQDVIEHVEDPAALLSELDARLAPGGHVLIGTPNAERIDLGRPRRFVNDVHAPYHLHILTPAVLEALGRGVGWRSVAFWDRAYFDCPHLGLNVRAGREYQRLIDDSLDAFFDPPRIGRALTSPRYLFFAAVGYWLSDRSNMAIMFRRP